MENNINHIALSTNFKHHGEHAGYQLLAQYTKPQAILGCDEKTADLASIFNQYKWLNEFKARFQYKYDLLHIYYAEEYLRFSTYINSVPVVATFHQPPEILQREIDYGDVMGRLYKWTHKLTKDRFNHLAAAIILHENQRPILEQVMDGNKIHCIPHGISINRIYKIASPPKIENIILTVGNWQRDWELYEDILKEFSSNDELKFYLINRSMDTNVLSRLNKYPNFEYHNNINDEQLYALYNSSLCLLLPLKSFTANNALNEALSCGCPTIMTNQGDDISISDNYLSKNKYPPISYCYRADEYVSSINDIYKLSDGERKKLSNDCIEYLKRFSWENIAKDTISVYNKILRDDN